MRPTQEEVELAKKASTPDDRYKSMYFWHMDIKYKDQDWTEGETGKVYTKDRAMEMLPKIQALRDMKVEVKNLKLCRINVVIEEEEEENERESEQQ
jgi:hypothetical protein